MNETFTGMTTRNLDLNAPMELTLEQRQQLRRLSALRDEEIDCTDIPELPAGARLYRPGKLEGAQLEAFHQRVLDQQIELALEPDVSQFFRETGGVTRTRINDALRLYMQSRSKRK